MEEIGIDPWWRDQDGSFQISLVRAPCESVVPLLREIRGMPSQLGDLLANDEAVGPFRRYPTTVFQLRGHDWTQVISWGWDVSRREMQDLSRRLSSLAFVSERSDSLPGWAYDLFEDGELIESFCCCWSSPADIPIYQGPEGEADLLQKLVEGWQISLTHMNEFFSKRGTELDIESEPECNAMLERVVRELGIYIAPDPFPIDWDRKIVRRDDRWGRERFAAAKILHD